MFEGRSALLLELTSGRRPALRFKIFELCLSAKMAGEAALE